MMGKTELYISREQTEAFEGSVDSREPGRMVWTDIPRGLNSAR